jgi:hypothetical protein
MTKLKLAFALALAAGCNAIAGISDFHTVDDQDGGPDASDDADAPLPTCSDPDVPLRITVIESKSGAFTGIADQGGLFSFLGVGHRFEQCVPRDATILDLRAQPGDPSNAVHDWGACGEGRRCNMTVTAATILDVRLQ